MSDEPKFTSETSVRIYNDQTGDYWQVGPDGDSLGLCAIRAYEGSDPKPVREIILPWEAALLLATGIQTTHNENMP